jgi:aminoglycoside phosphotransferase
VRKHLTAWLVASLSVAFYTLPARSADDAALNKELTALLGAQHLPCGKIVNISTQADRDYLVSCQDGSNYQINANSDGQLMPHPLGQKKIH